MRVALALGALMLTAVVGANALAPTTRLSEVRQAVDLDRQIPKAFGDWQVDPSIIPILPSPDVQARLDMLYTQVLARTYVNSRGQRVMLSIAYGSDQGSDATAVHRPEFCYSAQGFSVASLGTAYVDMGASSLQTRRLLARAGDRVEPITYWVTLDETATLPGLGRKLAQLRYGLRGEIPDGMLVRISTIDPRGGDSAFEVHHAFMAAMQRALPGSLRSRYFGAAGPRTAS